jgi:hypothetical protein
MRNGSPKLLPGVCVCVAFSRQMFIVRSWFMDALQRTQRETSAAHVRAVSRSQVHDSESRATLGNKKSPRADGLMPICRRALWIRGLF